MPKMPSAILIFGDKYLSKNAIISAKRNFQDYQFETISASKSTYDDIRADVGTYDWADNNKAIIIEDFPNNKATREFLLDICQDLPEDRSVILRDTLNSIKIDSKTKKVSTAWQDFIKEFESIKDSKVLNSGVNFTEKDGTGCVMFIRKCFQKYNKDISEKEANLFMQITGMDKGIIISEVEKMVLTAPDNISADFIMENAFYVSQEVILYKFANVLDSCSHKKILESLEQFIRLGIHPNVLAEVMMKKARWQLAASYFFSEKLPWNIIVDRLMDMGEFPSFIWHNLNLSKEDKKAKSEPYQGADDIINFMSVKQGIPKRLFKNSQVKPKILKSGKPSKAKGKSPKTKAERIPLRFMASQTTAFIRDRIVKKSGQKKDVRKSVLNRAIKVYLFAYKKLVETRTAHSPIECLREMALSLTDTKL